MITQELVKELFDYMPETGELIWKADRGVNKTAGKVAGGITRSTGYRFIEMQGKKYAVHRIIFLYHNGHSPKIVDHIDRNPGNNRIENLRAANDAQSASNVSKRPKASSKWKGVSYQAAKGWWRAYISFENNLQYLGKFDCEATAATVYNFFAQSLHGEFASYNLAAQTCPLVA